MSGLQTNDGEECLRCGDGNDLRAVLHPETGEVGDICPECATKVSWLRGPDSRSESDVESDRVPSSPPADVDPRLHAFVELFNICYPDWRVNGSTDNALEPRHVDFDASLESYWGRCGPRNRGRVYYRVNPDWWAEQDAADRVGLLIHELAHVKDTTHNPSFWEQVVENYKSLSAHAETVDAVMDATVDWTEVREFLVTDPTNESVDNRREIVYERRRKIAEAIGYEKSVEPFAEMSILTRSYTNRDDHVRVSVDQIRHETYDIEELVDFFHSHDRSGLRLENGAYVIEPPVVKRTGGEYEVVEGSKRLALAKQAVIEGSSRNSIGVKLQED